MNTSRRTFLSLATLGTAAAAGGSLPLSAAAAPAGTAPLPVNQPSSTGHYRPPSRFGLGGVAIGNGFKPTPDDQAQATLAAAWEAGVRYFDTSPWYGLGLSERRFGHFLDEQDPDSYVLSTKIGRLTKPDRHFTHGMWKGRLGFNYAYDYTAEGTRRSIEDSLQRMGLSSIDIVFIHDLSPDNGDLKERWTESFEVAVKGAMPELTRMREEGLIKGWGLGVNTIEPILRTLEAADPDIFLSATQYSLMHHEDALQRLFPACESRGVSLVIGAPLNAGFLAGLDRYNYGGTIPAGFQEKRARIQTLAKEHGTDLRTAALQFTTAPPVVAATIPGARSPQQVQENVASMSQSIPAEFWDALKAEGLIAKEAPVPRAVA